MTASPIARTGGFFYHAFQRQRGEPQRASYLQHDLLPHLDCGYTPFQSGGTAQPAGDFWIYSAVRTGQPHVLGELAASTANSPLSAFSFDHEWPFPFRQDEKKMGIQSGAA